METIKVVKAVLLMWDQFNKSFYKLTNLDLKLVKCLVVKKRLNQMRQGSMVDIFNFTSLLFYHFINLLFYMIKNLQV